MIENQKFCPFSHTPESRFSEWWRDDNASFFLTIDLTASQLQPKGRFAIESGWIDPNISSHNRWIQPIFFYCRGIRIAIKILEEKRKAQLYKNSL